MSVLASSLRIIIAALLVTATAIDCSVSLLAAEHRLIGHWPLTEDARDRADLQQHAVNHGGKLAASGVQLDGVDDWLEVKSSPATKLGTGDFTISAWIKPHQTIDDSSGDIVSCYDPATRTGFHLSLKTNEVTTSRANSRMLHFGIDRNQMPSQWRDHGQVGKATFVFGFATHRGTLYAGTCEPQLGNNGRVYRWNGADEWIDCGVPNKANSVSALATFQDQLYVGTGKYRLAGSALKESENTELGGRIFRYEEDGSWTDCGQLPNTEAIGGLTVFRDQLYAGSLYRPAGFFRYEGGQKWTSLEAPNGKRVEAMYVFNGELFASSYDEGHVFRFDGQKWTDCGQVGDATNTQTYSFAVYHGKLHVGTWRSGKVFRYEGDNNWIDVGRLGEELEVMGMLVHNGRLLAGSLPLAGVYQYEDAKGPIWLNLGYVDKTPDVMYRRAWTMAEFGGRTFVGTLPSGRVLSNSAGVNVTYDHELSNGWHHVAARRAAGKLTLHVDGKQVAESDSFDSAQFDLSTDVPLKIGFGSNDYFHGELRDVRIYSGALPVTELKQLASP